MKSTMLALFLLLTAFCGKAQNIRITNNSCQEIRFSIQAARIPVCNSAYTTSSLYGLAPGGTLQFSMYPTGPYPQPAWGPTIIPNCQYINVRVLDPAGGWGGSVQIPCSGGPSSFNANGIACMVHVTSNWSNPNSVIVNVY